MFALMSALGHERFNIIGWSDGGNIAVIMAAERPERVAKLVVFGGQSFLTAEEIAALNNIRNDFRLVTARRRSDARGLWRWAG